MISRDDAFVCAYEHNRHGGRPRFRVSKSIISSVIWECFSNKSDLNPTSAICKLYLKPAPTQDEDILSLAEQRYFISLVMMIGCWLQFFARVSRLYDDKDIFIMPLVLLGSKLTTQPIDSEAFSVPDSVRYPDLRNDFSSTIPLIQAHEWKLFSLSTICLLSRERARQHFNTTDWSKATIFSLYAIVTPLMEPIWLCPGQSQSHNNY